MPAHGAAEFDDAASLCSDGDAYCASDAAETVASRGGSDDEFHGALEFDAAAMGAATAAIDAAEAAGDSDGGGAFGLPARTGGGSRLVFWVVVLTFGVAAVAVAMWYVNRGKRRRPAPLADPNGQTVDLTACFQEAAAAKAAAAATAAAGQRGVETAVGESGRAATAATAATPSAGGGGGEGEGGEAGQQQEKPARTVWGIVFPSRPFLGAVAKRAADQQALFRKIWLREATFFATMWRNAPAPRREEILASSFQRVFVAVSSYVAGDEQLFRTLVPEWGTTTATADTSDKRGMHHLMNRLAASRSQKASGKLSVPFPADPLFWRILGAMENQISLEDAPTEEEAAAQLAVGGSGGGGGGTAPRRKGPPAPVLSSKDKKLARTAAVRAYVSDFRLLCLLALSTAVIQKFNETKLPATLAEATRGPKTMQQRVAGFIGSATKGTLLTFALYYLSSQLFALRG